MPRDALHGPNSLEQGHLCPLMGIKRPVQQLWWWVGKPHSILPLVDLGPVLRCPLTHSRRAKSQSDPKPCSNYCIFPSAAGNATCPGGLPCEPDLGWGPKLAVSKWDIKMKPLFLASDVLWLFVSQPLWMMQTPDTPDCKGWQGPLCHWSSCQRRHKDVTLACDFVHLPLCFLFHGVKMHGVVSRLAVASAWTLQAIFSPQLLWPPASWALPASAQQWTAALGPAEAAAQPPCASVSSSLKQGLEQWRPPQGSSQLRKPWELQCPGASRLSGGLVCLPLSPWQAPNRNVVCHSPEPQISIRGARFQMCVCCSVVSNPLQPRGLQPARLLYTWDSPGKDTGVGCYFLLQIPKGACELVHWTRVWPSATATVFFFLTSNECGECRVAHMEKCTHCAHPEAGSWEGHACTASWWGAEHWASGCHVLIPSRPVGLSGLALS